MRHLTEFDPQVVVALSGETLNNLIGMGQNTDQKLFNRAVLVPGRSCRRPGAAGGFPPGADPDALTPVAMTGSRSGDKNEN